MINEKELADAIIASCPKRAGIKKRLLIGTAAASVQEAEKHMPGVLPLIFAAEHPTRAAILYVLEKISAAWIAQPMRYHLLPAIDIIYRQGMKLTGRKPE